MRNVMILLMLSMISVSMCWTQAVPGTPAGQRPNRPHDPNRIEPLTLVLRAGGFGTDRIRVPSGRYQVSVFNRTGKDNIPIAFERIVGGGVPTEGQTIRNAIPDVRTSRFAERLTLQRGTYRLRVPTQPRWVLTIEVN